MSSRSPLDSVFSPVQRDAHVPSTPLSSSSIPVPTSGLSSSYLGKRGASTAGPDSASHKRALSSVTALQSQLLAAERREAEANDRTEDMRVEMERLKSERRVLHDGETLERETGEAREREWANERLRLSTQLRELRSQNSTLSDSLQKMQSDHAQLAGQHASLTQHSSAELSLLASRIREIENERDALRGWERRAKGLSIELEEERRRAAEGRQREAESAEDRRAEDALRKEFRRQGQQFTGYQSRIAQLEAENSELRSKRKEAEGADRARQNVEWTLKEEIKTLQAQLERSRRDMDSLTQSFPATPTSDDHATLQSRLAAMSALHAEATNELASKDAEIRGLQSRLSEQSASALALSRELSQRNNELEREVRWSKEGRASAERREKLLQKELDATREAGPSMPGGASFGDQSARVKQLEGLVETYRAELGEIQRDSREVEDRLTKKAGLVPQSALDEAQGEISKLKAGEWSPHPNIDIEALDSTIAQLTSANTTLDAEVNDLMRRVASGEYNPATERCIELRSNPASKVHAVRTKQLEDLRTENDALLQRLKSVDKTPVSPGAEGAGLVPRESFERLSREKEDLERAHAKRLLRLKEIFGMKSKEFLEAVYSLLGWRIKFDESGADIRLTSMYAPKGKMGLTLKFASQEGHFGTMQMTGAMAKGLEEARHFWITERQSVPGFLAQVTTEMFEKTTIGRAAGYVGLE
ncbi:hypothetical protein JCM24511_05646 [Saitozyma sp. JCM 24511]|nr:hypothetical protein JCM24511_05646 [Saitozyma sp. JCM 24511]